MATIHDYGTPADTLAAPSLSEWAAAVAAHLDARTLEVGGVSHGSGSIPSSATGSTAFTVLGTPAVWGGMTASTSFLLAPITGRYRIGFQAAFPSGTGGTVRAAWIWNNVGDIPDPNGQPIAAYAPPNANTTGVGNTLTGSGVWTLTAGDMVRIYLRQDAGSTLACSGTLSVTLIRGT